MTETQKEEVIKRGYAKNSEEWWFLVEHNWTNIHRIMGTYLTQKEMDAAETAKNRRNSKVMYVQLCNTWERMPDSGWVQQVPGFLALCDLCSDFHG